MRVTAFDIEASFQYKVCDTSPLYYGAAGPNVGLPRLPDQRI